MASLDWRQGPLEDAGRSPQSCAGLAAALKRQKTELVSHVSDADDDDDDDVHLDDDDDDDDPNETCHLAREVTSFTNFGFARFQDRGQGYIYIYMCLSIYLTVFIYLHMHAHFFIYIYMNCPCILNIWN